MLLQAEAGPSVGQLLVIVVGAIPIMGIMGWSAVKILGPLGQAFAKRLGGGSVSDDLEPRVDALVAELEELKHQLAETHERLDFTERMLAQSRTPDQLPHS